MFLDKQEAMPEKKSVLWEEELSIRELLLSSVSEQKKLFEQAGKKRPVDQLRVSQHLAPISHIISSPDLVMSLGLTEPTSVYVPEKPYYDGTSLIHRLAYCEVYSYRYKHIDLQRLYAFDKDETVRSNFVHRPRETLLS